MGVDRKTPGIMTKEQEIDFAWRRYMTPLVDLIREKKERKIRLCEQQNWRCCYCGCELEESGENRATIEHIVPKSAGGSNHKSNLVIACNSCNSRRGVEMRDEHYEALSYRDWPLGIEDETQALFRT